MFMNREINHAVKYAMTQQANIRPTYKIQGNLYKKITLQSKECGWSTVGSCTCGEQMDVHQHSETKDYVRFSGVGP